MNILILRHLRIFFRDKGNVFFALLSSIVMFVLYLLFLGNLQAESLLDEAPGLSSSLATHFVNAWVFAGILTITAVTTSLGAFNVFISDRAEGRLKDFAVSPVPRWKLMVSYIVSAIIVSSALTLFAAAISQGYLLLSGGEYIGTHNLLRLVPLLILLSTVFSAVACLIATFIKSAAAFTSLSIIIGTSVGFLAGIYVPVGALPTAVANVVNSLPFAQSASLTRDIFAEKSLMQVAAGDDSRAELLRESYGFTVSIGDIALSESTILTVLIAIGCASLLLATVRMAKVLKTA
jgi:multidrug/hemolysin transport system permease protein